MFIVCLLCFIILLLCVCDYVGRCYVYASTLMFVFQRKHKNIKKTHMLQRRRRLWGTHSY